MLDVLLFLVLLLGRLLLQCLADQLLIHLLILVNDMQERLLRLGMFVIVVCRSVNRAWLHVRARNVRLLAGAVLAILRGSLVCVEQHSCGLPTFTLTDLLARGMRGLFRSLDICFRLLAGQATGFGCLMLATVIPKLVLALGGFLEGIPGCYGA